MTKDIPALRASIDDIDDQLAALLARRCEFVTQVGAIKRSEQAEGASFIRAGREADMVRRMYNTLKDKHFPAPAAAHMWRIIISASLSLESTLTVTACAPNAQHELYWLAREYFGNFTPISRDPSARRIMGEILDGKTQVGVLPLPGESEEGQWWIKLPDSIKIFACVPFVLAKGSPVKAVAVARVTPEATGDDLSLFSFETVMDVSQSRLKAVFDKHKLLFRWITTESFPSGHRAHLVEFKGFHTIEEDAMRELKKEIGANLLAVKALGAYALPIIY
jgi:chorismate mutase